MVDNVIADQRKIFKTRHRELGPARFEGTLHKRTGNERRPLQCCQLVHWEMFESRVLDEDRPDMPGLHTGGHGVLQGKPVTSLLSSVRTHLTALAGAGPATSRRLELCQSPGVLEMEVLESLVGGQVLGGEGLLTPVTGHHRQTGLQVWFRSHYNI